MLIGVVREMLEKAPAPRNVFAAFRLGQVFGAPGNAVQQRTLLADTLAAFQRAERPGVIIDLPYRWKRSAYSDPLATR